MSTRESWAPAFDYVAEFGPVFGPWMEQRAFGDWELAMHLISAHADPMAVCRSGEDNADQHHHEHTGPCTIRNHTPASRVFDEKKIELVLEEIEEDEGHD